MHILVKKNFEFLRRECSRPPKQLERGNFDRVFVMNVQLKRPNFKQWESFWGPVYIPRMCRLYLSFVGVVWFGHCEPPKNDNFGSTKVFLRSINRSPRSLHTNIV